MKLKWCLTGFLLLVLRAGVQLHAQQNDTNSIASVKVKAEQGDAEAQNTLGFCYANGRDVARDYSEALKWYHKAANQSSAVAQFNIGIMYENGNGVRKDNFEAFKWYQKAAKQGYAPAQCNLGFFYIKGMGAVEKDYLQARKWLHKAAVKGDAEAQNNLGFLYWQGLGVPEDDVEAYKWYYISSAQGNRDAIKNRDNIARSMMTSQIAEAQQLARNFKLSKAPAPGATASAKDIFDSSPEASGSGFFVTADGYLITNHHVIEDAVQIRLVTDAGFLTAKIIRVDVVNDLALLKVDGVFSSLPISPSRTVQLGGTVVTIGFPDIGLQGFSPKLAKGEIASLSGIQDDPRYFQISVPVQPGNSGGALVDEHGNVVGIVSAKLNASVALAATGALPENVNYAVKSSFLLGFLASVPEVSAKLKEPVTVDRKFEDVVKSAQDAAVLVLVY